MRSILALPALVAFAACAPPLQLQMPKETHIVAAPVSADAALGMDSITIQVRYFPHSPDVSVLAWRKEDAGLGLRARFRTDGSQINDHVIWVSSSYAPEFPQSPRARIPTRRLEPANGVRDDYACHFGECTPFVTSGAAIPDNVLRATQGSLPVLFYEDASSRPRVHPLLGTPDVQLGAREMTLTVDSALIAAYLGAVDAVQAQLRRRN